MNVAGDHCWYYCWFCKMQEQKHTLLHVFVISESLFSNNKHRIFYLKWLLRHIQYKFQLSKSASKLQKDKLQRRT